MCVYVPRQQYVFVPPRIIDPPRRAVVARGPAAGVAVEVVAETASGMLLARSESGAMMLRRPDEFDD